MNCMMTMYINDVYIMCIFRQFPAGELRVQDPEEVLRPGGVLLPASGPVPGDHPPD